MFAQVSAELGPPLPGSCLGNSLPGGGFGEVAAAVVVLPAGTPAGEARDILWTFTSPELWELLVIQRGWTPARYGQWLASMLTAALLLPQPQPG